MRIFIILLVLLGGSISVFGQNFKASTFHVNGGLSWPDMKPVNSLLQDPDSCRSINCYGNFRNSFFSFGFGAEGINNRFVWQADGYLYAIANPGGRSEAFMLNILQYYYATFRLGYVISGQNDGDYAVVIYPYVGGGGGTGQLRLSNDGTDRFFRFNTFGYMLDAGLSLNTYTRLPGSDQSFKFGGSIGYYLAPASAWSLDGTTSAEPLPISPQGLYVRLCLGIGKVDN
ncbi:MAG: hypothetical protein R3B47_01075 [Bacteroidia bacterium]